MSYFSSVGISAGPIKVDSTWIKNSIILWDANGEQQNTQYLSFTFDKNGSYGVPLYAGSPFLSYKEVDSSKAKELGVYKNGSKYYQLNTPLNSVITAKFLAAYTAIAPGDLTFNPDEFVTQKELNDVKIVVQRHTTEISSLEKDVDILSSRTDALELDVYNNKMNIQDIYNNLIDNWLKNGVVIQCGPE